MSMAGSRVVPWLELPDGGEGEGSRGDQTKSSDSLAGQEFGALFFYV